MEKDLLLQDLCSRLLYEVFCKVEDTQEPVKLKGITPDRDKPIEIYDDGEEKSSTYYYINEVKPYLRPMSSMSEEERNEYFDIKMQECERVALSETCRPEAISVVFDWLNKHHFDYRGLIEKELALPAPEEMYK